MVPEDDPQTTEVSAESVIQYGPFVRRMVGSYWHSGLGIDYEDLMQEGYLGLLEAVSRWDPDRGVRFLTYAVWWVRKHILLHLSEKRQNIRVPATRRDQVRRAEGLMTAELRMQTMEPCLLGELPLPQENHASLKDLQSALPEESCLEGECSRLVYALLENIPDRLREILILRYGLDGRGTRTLRETATTLSLSRERIRQLEGRALTLLRQFMGETKTPFFGP